MFTFISDLPTLVMNVQTKLRRPGKGGCNLVWSLKNIDFFENFEVSISRNFEWSRTIHVFKIKLYVQIKGRFTQFSL